MYNAYFYIIISFIIIFFIFDKIINYLNTLNWSNILPKELESVYDKEKYANQQLYEKTKYKFLNIYDFFSFIIILFILFFWWFWYLDSFLRIYTDNQIILALYFFWIIFFIKTLIELPFLYYQIFVIEEKFWFNKMTNKLFIIDTIKSFLLTMIIWWLLLSLIVWIYIKIWTNFWFITWIILSLISIFIIMFYSNIIVPIFNKQTQLEDWDLKSAINEFIKKVWFQIDNIFVIDWSKRSSKANAYFSWFWPKKRIVLYDTLINNLTISEIVAVLAHEIGHYKKKHTFQMLIFSIIQMWFMLFLFSIIIDNKEISIALWSNNPSFHIWTIAFFILFTPISLILWIIWNILSRKNEYEADKFAKTYNYWNDLISWLKKLSINNLSNLLPHPIYEFIHYSHPTVLKRINELKK